MKCVTLEPILLRRTDSQWVVQAQPDVCGVDLHYLIDQVYIRLVSTYLLPAHHNLAERHLSEMVITLIILKVNATLQEFSMIYSFSSYR